MIPENDVAVLVQAFEFELLDNAGNVRGEWSTDVPAPGGNPGAIGLLLTFPDDPPLDPELESGVIVETAAGLRALWLTGPRADESGPPAHRGLVVLAATVPDALRSLMLTGNPAAAAFPGFEDQAALVDLIRTGPAGAYVTVAALVSGHTRIDLGDSTAGSSSATLKRGSGGAALELVSEETTTVDPPALSGFTLDAGALAVRHHPSGLVSVQFTARNTSGGPIATPCQVAELPPGFAPGLADRFAAGYSTLGACRLDITQAGPINCTINGGGNIVAGGYVTGTATFVP